MLEKLNIMKKKPQEIQKSIELENVLGSYIDSEMEYGDVIRMTPLAEKLMIRSGKKKLHNPHVDTVKNRLLGFFVVRDILNMVKWHFNDNKLVAIEKVLPEEIGDLAYKKEVRGGISNILNKLEILERDNKNLRKIIKSHIIKSR